ncbi:MAG: hypothetical protein D6776_05950 [Planctomycetota bacterium]|nr:MAG: hypothetical protein D6776_05950 [Planctomycetota bacterium]
MGLLDRIREGMRDGYDALEQTARDAVQAGRELASEAVEAVTGSDGAEAQQATAAPAAVDSGRSAANVSGHFRAAGIRARLQEASPTDAAQGVEAPADESLSSRALSWVREQGEAVREAGQRLRESAHSLSSEVEHTVRQGLEEVGRGAEAIGDGLTHARDRIANTVREAGRSLTELGERGVELAERGVRSLRDGVRDTAREALDGARSAAESIRERGERLVESVTDTLDPAAPIGRLDSEGDSVTVKVGGFGQAIVRGEGEAEMQVRRVADGYEVEVGGRVGLGAIAQLGGEAGEEAEASARALGNVTGRTTLHFESREDAERAVRLLAREAASTAASTTAQRLVPGLGHLAGVALDAAIGPDPAEQRFLGEHTRSIELRGGVAGAISASLSEAETLGGEAGAKLDGQVGVVLHLPERDPETGAVTRPARIATIQQITLEVEGEASAVEAAGAKGETTVRLEQEYELPASASLDALVRDPATTLRAIRDQTRPTTARLKIEGAAHVGAGVAGAYVHAQGQAGAGYEIEGEIEHATARAVVRRLADGDLSGAMEQLGDDTRLRMTSYGYAQDEVRFSPELSVEGFGGGAEASYALRDRGEPITVETTPREALERIRAATR